MRMENTRTTPRGGKLTTWIVEAADHLEMACFDLRPGDELRSKWTPDGEKPVAICRAGERSVDVRVGQLERWEFGRAQSRGKILGPKHARIERALKSAQAQEQQTRNVSVNAIREFIGSPIGDAYAEFTSAIRNKVEELYSIPDTFKPILTAGEVDAMLQAPKVLTTHEVDVICRSPKKYAAEPVGVSEASMHCHNGVRPSDQSAVFAYYMTQPPPAGTVEYIGPRAHPAISGLGVMTPVLAFNSKRDTRI